MPGCKVVDQNLTNMDFSPLFQIVTYTTETSSISLYEPKSGTLILKMSPWC